MRVWDVIILGAGPAGLALAARLAPQYRVLVVERLAAPATGMRIGESLPGAAARLLTRLGIYQDFLTDGHRLRTATVSHWASAAPTWEDGLRDPLGPGWVLDRRAFEARLGAAAQARGAVIEYDRADTAPISVMKNCDHYWHCQGPLHTDSAPVLIDASGRSAMVARRLGVAQYKLDQQICIHAFYRQRQGASTGLTQIIAAPNGWWYHVGLAGGAGVLALHTDARTPERAHLTTSAGFRAAVAATPELCALGEQVDFEAIQVRPAGSCVLDIAALAQCPPGFLAIGDALISFDPIAAQGLFHALASAESAARAIAQNLATSSAARIDFCHEQQQIRDHYLARLAQVYRTPVRFAGEPFWSARATSLAQRPVYASEMADA